MPIRITTSPLTSNNELVKTAIVKSGTDTSIPYAKSRTTSMTMGSVKMAQFGGGSASSGNALFTPPQFFNPLHTPQEWQIASKRREEYLWSRHWYKCFTPENKVLLSNG